MVPDRYVRASDFDGKLGQANNPEWKTVAFDEAGKVVLPNGAIGFRWGPDGRADQGQWNLEAKEAQHGNDVKLKLSVLEGDSPSTRNRQGRLPVLRRHRQRAFPEQRAARRERDVLVRTVPVQRIALGKDGDKREALVATVFDLQVANYGVARGLPGELAATSFDDDTPYTPAWQERITGTPRAQVITVARQFAENARQDAGQVDGDHRRGDEPLVPQRHELPRRHQHADDVRLHRQERRRLGALRRPGKAAAADRLDRARLRARLDPPAAPAEQHQLLLRAHRPVALREAGHGRGALAARRQEASTAAA